MAIKYIKRIANLDGNPPVDILPGGLFTGESKAHVFMIFCRQGPQAIALSGGTVSGDFLNASNQSVACTGRIVNGVAVVQLPPACYTVRGRFTLTIYHTQDGATGAIYRAEGKVLASGSDTALVPGTTVASVAQLVAEIEAAVASIPADYSDLLDAIAPEYTGLTFPVAKGQPCWYGGILYKAKQDLSASESWTAAHWETAVIGEDVADLKSAIDTLNEECGVYVPPSASGTTAANSSVQTVLTPLALIKGHTYKYEVEYASASDAASYLSLWITGAGSYSGVVTIAAGATSGNKTHTATVNTDAAYLALTTNGRALDYTVKCTDLSVGETRIDAMEDDIAEIGNSIEEIGNNVDEIGNNVDEINKNLRLVNPVPIAFTVAETGKYVNAGTGAIANAANTSLSVTDYINIERYNKITYKRMAVTASSPSGGIAFYDAGKTYISGIYSADDQSADGYFTDMFVADVPDNAVYMRATLWTDTDTYGVFAVNGVNAADDRLDTAENKIGNMETVLGVYHTPTASGTSEYLVSTVQPILENLKFVANTRYRLTFSITNPVDANVYIGLYDGVDTNYKHVMTLSAGQTTKTQTYLVGFNATAGYLGLSTNGRLFGYTVTLEHLVDHPNSIDTINADIDGMKDATETVQYNAAHLTDLTPTLAYYAGSMDTTGAVNPSASGYHYTSKFPVNPGDVVYTTNTNTPYRMITAFNGDAVVPSAGDTNKSKYTVPSGVNGLVLTVYDAQSTVAGAVMRRGYSDIVSADSQQAQSALMNASHTYAKRTPMVTFIDDDGNVECYTDLLPIFKTHGVPLVSAYMGDRNPDMESNTAMMTKEQCREVVQNGGEIIVHYGTDLTTLTLEAAEDLVLKSKYWLEKHGFYSRLVAYSNGTSNSAIRAMISKHFDGAFSGAYPRVSNTDRSNHGCIVQYAIHREPCGGFYYDSTPASRSLQYFKDMIDECIAANGWLVLTLHSWLMPEGKRQEAFADVDQLGLLEDIIEYIEELQTGGSNIRVVTASEGFATFGNAWQAGDYLGYWNEQTLTNTPTLGDHSQPGCAINKLGQYDFPAGNNLNA